MTTPKYISFFAHCSDCCCTRLIDEKLHRIAERVGYVPRGFGIGGGDDVELIIDLETGQILNWKKPEAEIVREFIAENEMTKF